MDIIVNTSKIIKLESIPNLNDVVLTIYKSDGNIVTTIAMNENIPNIYEAEFLPPIIGNYTGKIASASLNLVTYFDINVATGVDLSSELTAAKNEIIAEVNANETKIDAIKAKTDQFSFTSNNVNAIAQVVIDKTGYSLTSAERTAIAVAVEQAILDDSDGQAILNAIVGAIGNSNIDEIALVAAIRADIERNGGMMDNLPTLNEIEASSALAKEDSVQLSIAVSV